MSRETDRTVRSESPENGTSTKRVRSRRKRADNQRDRFRQRADLTTETEGLPLSAKLQRQYGNHAIQRLLSRDDELTVRRADDQYEREVDRSSALLGADVGLAPRSESGPIPDRPRDQPLPRSVRSAAESLFGERFDDVRVHADSRAGAAADALDARAFTAGRDIYFQPGEYRPNSEVGRRLLAHELTHVVQQSNGITGIQRKPDESEASPPAGHAPTTPEQLIERYTSWLGTLDEEGLAEQLFWLAWMSPRHYAFVRRVLDVLDDSDRDDVVVELIDGARDENLDQFAATPEGRKLLDRFHDELVSGYPSEREERQARRIVEAKERQISPESFTEGAEGAMIFPFRPPGFTVFNDAPLTAERLPNGNVRVELPVRVLGTAEFRAETRTLPTEVFLSGYELPPDRIVGVKRYDLGGKVTYMTAEGLIGLGAQITRTIFQKIGETVFIGATLGTGGLAATGVRATWGARAALWADRVATALYALTTVVDEHRGWILASFPEHGSAFLRAVDVANSVATVYGLGQLGVGGYRAVMNLRRAWWAWRGQVARAKDLSAAERRAVSEIDENVTEILESTESARATGSQGRTGTEPEPIPEAQEVRVSPEQYQAALRHTFPSHSLDFAYSLADSIGRQAAQLAVADPRFVAAVRNRNMTLAGTLFHSAAANVARGLPASAVPPGWSLRAEFTIQAGRGGSRADLLLVGPNRQMIEFDWKTSGRSALSSGSRSEMQRHAGQITANIGGNLVRQESRSWVDFVREVWPDAPWR